MTVPLVLFLAAFLAWLVSTLAGGGGALLMIPIITWVANPRAVAPAIALGTLLSAPVRVWLFWRDVDWRIVRWYVPGAVAGGVLGGYVFAHAEPAWIKIVSAVFLLSTLVQYRFGEGRQSFPMRAWAFLPVAFVVSAISGMIGEAGPVLNPFFLNYGAEKETMIGTKAVNSLATQLAKLGTYSAFGAITAEFLLYGVAIGVAATLASLLGKRLLGRMEGRRFRQFVIAVMVVTGALMLWQERGTLVSWW